jgi:hypothetical protein
MGDRATGQDITVQLFKVDVLQDELNLITEATITFEQSVSLQDYLGMNQQLPDGKFDIAKLEFTAHQDSAAWIDFVEAIISKQMRLPGAPTSINCTIICTFPSTGQVRGVLFENLHFGPITITMGSRKDMVENGFTCYATKHQFQN